MVPNEIVQNYIQDSFKDNFASLRKPTVSTCFELSLFSNGQNQSLKRYSPQELKKYVTEKVVGAIHRYILENKPDQNPEISSQMITDNPNCSYETEDSFSGRWKGLPIIFLLNLVVAKLVVDAWSVFKNEKEHHSHSS
jgi:hypothetical protein